ncbi:Serine/threonine-protein kinase tel1 [Myotisia sp. PD_48]|nr:Serine/threonine-protein kinase tel1 [Myotisia sp. PD_48]
MEEVSVDQAITLITSSRLKDRTEGLEDLKHILVLNRHSSILDSLDDKAYHGIFEALFRFIALEKSSFTKANRNASKSQSAARLGKCASVIRTTVEVALRDIRPKTVIALVNHITDTLPVPGDGVWETLSNDYVKTLRTILQYPPHIEHLNTDSWIAIVQFCLRGIGLMKESSDSQLSIRTTLNVQNENVREGDRDSPFTGTPQRTQHARLDSKSNSEEFELCIQLLVSCPNVAVLKVADQLLAGLTEYLSSLNPIGNSPSAAFAALNVVLSKAITENVSLSRDIMRKIIPAIRHFWATKSVMLKEEMLTTLVVGKDILRGIYQSSFLESDAQLLQDLLDQMHHGYLRLPEREILQVDDLMFSLNPSSAQMGIGFVAPNISTTKAIQNWTTLSTIAYVSNIVDKFYAQPRRDQVDHEQLAKKQHLSSRSDDIFREASHAIGMARICALQMLPFFLSEIDLDIETLSTILGQLTPALLDDNILIASWSAIAVASLASCGNATSDSLKGRWVQVWNLSIRNISSPATSRVTCYLMSVIMRRQLLEYADISRSLDSLVSSAELNGPSSITDSALCLWVNIVESWSKANITQSHNLVKQICGWLKSSWTLGNPIIGIPSLSMCANSILIAPTDRIHTNQMATFSKPIALLNLLLGCSDRPLSAFHPPFIGPVGSILKGWDHCRQNSKLINYLLLSSENELQAGWKGEKFCLICPSSRQHPSDTLILELLQNRVDSFHQAWIALHDDKGHYFTADVIRILTSLCLTVNVYIEAVPLQTFRSRNLQESVNKLWKSLCEVFSKEEETLRESLRVLSPLVLSVDPQSNSKDALLQGMSKMAELLAPLLDRCKPTNSTTQANDAMDLDRGFSMRENPTEEMNTISKLNRNHGSYLLFSDESSIRAATSIQLSMIYKIQASNAAQNSLETLITEYLTSLNSLDVLVSWQYIINVFSDSPVVTRASACLLVEHFGGLCLEGYELERCEAAICACISLLQCFVGLWTKNERDDLFDSACELYEWFINVILGKGLWSTKILIRLADLLEAILRINPQLLKENRYISPRTSLFRILYDGDLLVKFHLSGLVPDIFGRFVLIEHDAIFTDVLESLPHNPDWDEGIALRLNFLADLASRWPTLLRRSIYHMFETSGRVAESAPYAKKCLERVSKALNLSDAKEIFRLFSPQILYTWMETESVNSIPYEVFGYSSLRDLLMDAQDEVVGQAVMRVKEEDMDFISACLEVPFHDLLDQSFYKAESYSVARDISIPPSQDPGAKGAESIMKKLLGAQKFLALMEKFFAQTIASLFKSVDQTEQIQKAFAKRQIFRYASDALQSINEKGHSQSDITSSQQPCFRARYLLDEIEFICKRAGYDIETMWTPPLVCFVARTLFDSIHPAFGSLHTCSVLRKLKVLVCIAGPAAVYDYTLEMLLRGLRPFLTDFHCCEDAIGLVWYLIDKGRAYLLDNPSFTAGLAVSTLASLRQFLSAPQESTTQKAHFTATQSKAQLFYDWFSQFLNDFNPCTLDESSAASFQIIIRASQNIKLSGNGLKGTYESELMLELLQDTISGRNLLSTHASEVVLSQLCDNFQGPENFRDDILGDDNSAVRNAIMLWKSVNSTGEGFRKWLARALGRAYAATGVLDKSLRKEQRGIFLHNSHADFLAGSKISILRILCDSLSSNNGSVGLAERTLQVIMSRLSKQPDMMKCEQDIPISLMKALVWEPYQCPELNFPSVRKAEFLTMPSWNASTSVSEFAKHLTLYLCLKNPKDAVIGVLHEIVFATPSFAVQLLPYVLHDVLLLETYGKPKTCHEVSGLFREALQDLNDSNLPRIRLIISCILYLRHQPLPNESTMDERDRWLDIDYMQAAGAATRCRMYKTSLLFIEIHQSQVAASARRVSAVKTSEPTDLLHSIYKNIDDPDLFYGIQQHHSLDTVLKKLEHETSGLKNLFFQNADYDTNLKLACSPDDRSSLEIVKALNYTNLQGLAASMFQSFPSGLGAEAFDCMLSTNLYLQQWDIPVPVTSSPTGTLFKALQGLNTLEDRVDIVQCLDDSFLEILGQVSEENQQLASLKSSMTALGILAEVDEILVSRTLPQVQEAWDRLIKRSAWLKFESYPDIRQILASHEAIFSSIKRKAHLKNIMNLNPRDAQLLEVKAIRETLKTSREHEILQASLKSAMTLSKLIQPCAELGVTIDAAATFDLANVLWDHGEMSTSIKMLQQLSTQPDLQSQSIVVSRAEVLASLGHHIAEARLEQPDAIIQNYLVPSIKELKSEHDGEEAGLVFHQFATFCDQQLQNPDLREDFVRLEQLRSRKLNEVASLEELMRTAEGKTKEQLRIHRTKAKQWFDLDDREYQRLKKSRESFLQQCLENYLLSLRACDTFSNDALRFCALWLDNSSNDLAHLAVEKYLPEVASRKFAALINQLSSRLQDIRDSFQPLLSALVFRICVDHPYHSMYHLFVSSRSKKDTDETAISRYNAAEKIVSQLKNSRRSGERWVAIHNTSLCYLFFAAEPVGKGVKPGAKLYLKNSTYGVRLQNSISKTKIPPPTMKIGLSIDCNYRNVPYLVGFQTEYTVASGLSTPKIVTAMASDGQRYKQLFKSGNDDLRQDAIMEQTFEQVSDLLQDHRNTRQRKLGIRTYKVLPLASNAGIIEFVQNTIPLHDYLMPAHQKHFPRDMKPGVCRKHINDVQTKSREQRIKVYRQVTDQFRPVMKFFFMERFPNPDDWFSKRLAYTRTTAAISVLGHILGLGDRHGHNILLDTKTGEVVHIDLGVAFEQGRVLPVPEMVPFRLTRDLVDGMGITKTEGVFRRCCEFTLEALRQESYSIMTILDVLRYDPLYSWTLSPLRRKKMQSTHEAEGDVVAQNDTGRKAIVNEPSEADRALTVVQKKLGKALSVAATVNELIQQATDEGNLALLYCGTGLQALMAVSQHQNRGIVVFSGGSAANNVVDVFSAVRESKDCTLSYIIPISDNGGSSSELIRVFGGPGIGDVRSRLVRLIPDSPADPERAAIKTFFNHRLSIDAGAAHKEWFSIIEGTSPLWMFISPAKKELIRSFLNLLNLEILKRARPPSGSFDFTSASVGNLFLTAARLFSGSFESAIYLLATTCSVPIDNVRVIPAINSNFSHHISASLEDGTVIVGQNSISHPSEASSIQPLSSDRRPSLLLADGDDLNLDSEEDPFYEESHLPGSLPTLRHKNIQFSKSVVDDLSSRISRVWYINPYGQEIRPPANPRVLEALRSSQAIIYSIGSLYTSLIPSLILRGVGHAISTCPARQKILILNGSLDRETGPPSQPFKASDFVEAIVQAAEASRGRCHPDIKRQLGDNNEGTIPQLLVTSPSYTSYVTHILYLEGPETPQMDRDRLNEMGIECMRLYGRKVTNESGDTIGMKYDSAALIQALEVVLGKKGDAMVKRGLSGERSRRNTMEGVGGK